MRAMHHCPQCDKRFTRAFTLQNHLRTHTGERPFLCGHCQKGFARRHDRQIHEAECRGEVQYTCQGRKNGCSKEICGQKFSRKTSLKRHIKNRRESQTLPTKDIFDPLADAAAPRGGRFEVMETATHGSAEGSRSLARGAERVAIFLYPRDIDDFCPLEHSEPRANETRSILTEFFPGVFISTTEDRSSGDYNLNSIGDQINTLVDRLSLTVHSPLEQAGLQMFENFFWSMTAPLLIEKLQIKTSYTEWSIALHGGRCNQFRALNRLTLALASQHMSTKCDFLGSARSDRLREYSHFNYQEAKVPPRPSVRPEDMPFWALWHMLFCLLFWLRIADATSEHGLFAAFLCFSAHLKAGNNMLGLCIENGLDTLTGNSESKHIVRLLKVLRHSFESLKQWHKEIVLTMTETADLSQEPINTCWLCSFSCPAHYHEGFGAKISLFIKQKSRARFVGYTWMANGGRLELKGGTRPRLLDGD